MGSADNGASGVIGRLSHANGIKSCHMWSFAPLPDGGTHVSNTEVFAGLPVALLRPLVARRWNRLFQGAVDGLIRRASAGPR
jgi:hypothetical protein